jgi:hypothetical protein
VDKSKILKQPVNAYKKSVSTGFLFEDDSATTIPQPSLFKQDDEDIKDIDATLKDSVTNTKKDLEDVKTKHDEIMKVLSVTKDNLKRNFLSKQLQDKKNELKNKSELLKNQESSLKNSEEIKTNPDVAKKEIHASLDSSIPNSSTILNMTEAVLRKKINGMINNDLKKNINPLPKKRMKAVAQPVEFEKPKRSVRVTFDKSSKAPWKVLFTERGFLIGNTRLSFENVEMAIHKNYNITLDGGEGLVLDQIRLNKILKYKDRF